MRYWRYLGEHSQDDDISEFGSGSQEVVHILQLIFFLARTSILTAAATGIDFRGKQLVPRCALQWENQIRNDYNLLGNDFVTAKSRRLQTHKVFLRKLFMHVPLKFWANGSAVRAPG